MTANPVGKIGSAFQGSSAGEVHVVFGITGRYFLTQLDSRIMSGAVHKRWAVPTPRLAGRLGRTASWPPLV